MPGTYYEIKNNKNLLFFYATSLFTYLENYSDFLGTFIINKKLALKANDRKVEKSPPKRKIKIRICLCCILGLMIERLKKHFEEKNQNSDLFMLYSWANDRKVKKTLRREKPKFGSV